MRITKQMLVEEIRSLKSERIGIFLIALMFALISILSTYSTINQYTKIERQNDKILNNTNELINILTLGE